VKQFSVQEFRFPTENTEIFIVKKNRTFWKNPVIKTTVFFHVPVSHRGYRGFFIFLYDLCGKLSVISVGNFPPDFLEKSGFCKSQIQNSVDRKLSGGVQKLYFCHRN